MGDTKSAFPVTTDGISYDDMTLHGGSRQIDYVAHGILPRLTTPSPSGPFVV